MAVFLAFGIAFTGDTGPSALDTAVAALVPESVTLAWWLAGPTEPYVLLPVLGLLAGFCLLRRDWPGLALTLAAPALTVAVNTWLLKPLFGRYYGGHLAYPSGHTVSLVAVLTVLALLTAGRARAAVVVTGVLLTAGAGAGMIRLGFHYATDVAGAAGFAVAAVTALAALPWPRRGPAPSAG
ncbi:phosphatase PAP2 family protein [Amycolatopsis suaedae]|uniref:Phosphatase PAP2 family protein n=2 Tax=Amycolatopsis suaedae TaxID=2510978 RepID=A0A4Q7J5G1_9PSEU|nr:phosphatase PAP2 family protein [Amycolatopsis suaedae]